MRICHVGRDIERTGGGEVLKQVAAHMAAAGHEVIVLTDTPPAATGLPPGVRVRATPFGARLLAWRPTRRMGWHARHALQIAVFTAFGTVAARRLRRRGFAIVNHNCEVLTGDLVVMHNTFSAEYRRRGLRGLRAVKALANPTRAMRLTKEHLLAVSRARRTFVAVADAAVSEVEGLVRGRHPVVAIPNAIDTERYRVADDAERRIARGRLGLADDRTAVAFVGHEFERKGLLELIAAMALLPEEAVLLVAGGASQDVPRFQAVCADAGVADRVRFLGEVGDVAGLFAATDVFCIPSRYETVPMVALEALACGVPTVVSDRCPAQRFVEPAVNGAVCTVDPASIATAVRAAALLPRGAAVRRAVEGESWSAAATRYVEVLEG